METDVIRFFGELLGLVPAVAFAAPLIAFVVDQAKRIGLPDGWAPLASGLLNIMFYALVWFMPDRERDIATITDAVYRLAPYIVALVVSLLGAARAHVALREIGIGYSHARG